MQRRARRRRVAVSLAVFVALGSMATPADAQRRALGLVMGVVESTQTRARQPDSEAHSGLMVGAWVDQQTPAPWLSVTAEAFLVRRGARYTLDDGFARQLDVDYVGAAVLPSLRASAGPASLVGYAGPAIDFHIRSQSSVELQGVFLQATGQTFAGLVGAAVEVTTRRTTFRVDARLHQQLSRAFEGEVSDAKHRSVEILFRLGMRRQP